MIVTNDIYKTVQELVSMLVNHALLEEKVLYYQHYVFGTPKRFYTESF